MQTAPSSARCSSLCRTASTRRTNTLCSESTRRPDSCVSLRTSIETRDRRSTTSSSKLKIQWVMNCAPCKVVTIAKLHVLITQKFSSFLTFQTSGRPERSDLRAHWGGGPERQRSSVQPWPVRHEHQQPRAARHRDPQRYRHRPRLRQVRTGHLRRGSWWHVQFVCSG